MCAAKMACLQGMKWRVCTMLVTRIICHCKVMLLRVVVWGGVSPVPIGLDGSRGGRVKTHCLSSDTWSSCFGCKLLSLGPVAFVIDNLRHFAAHGWGCARPVCATVICNRPRLATTMLSDVASPSVFSGMCAGLMPLCAIASLLTCTQQRPRPGPHILWVCNCGACHIRNTCLAQCTFRIRMPASSTPDR